MDFASSLVSEYSLTTVREFSLLLSLSMRDCANILTELVVADFEEVEVFFLAIGQNDLVGAELLRLISENVLQACYTNTGEEAPKG
jgi:hypothetical protein